ncbi:MAG: VCBS repeat-containing protein [Winogradskyella sp.]|uniref:VCBS repeat-containing protein n=1 Tax=Winogradskyella sp. TaxID=1883156 RepID=UPI00179B35E5|nr:VCBS repeat-containing protein [Winogradskyella sp.]MBT8245799.1 VCBS repeat-containing protein [Winogradskyella sp.]NNK22412.1 VCBS repeat-containing protein [Winogradskyella sp.]
MKFIKHISLSLIFILCFSCKDEAKEESTPKASKNSTAPKIDTHSLFTYLEPSTTNIDFKNIIDETESFNFILYAYLYNGGGVAVGDINNDGLDDIYFTGNTASDKLYLNQGNFRFKDITATAKVGGGKGFKTGVTMVDINNDGFLDIYVCKSAVSNEGQRKNKLYINNGDLTFSEEAENYGLADSGHSVQAYFFDSDGDSDLDVFVLNHTENMLESNMLKVSKDKDGVLGIAVLDDYTGRTDRFYVNNENKFIDESEEAGILSDAFGLSAVVGDFNNDFKPDLYVCNDYSMPDKLFINQGNNQFEDELSSYFSNTSFSSMGSDYADVNNDGNFDLMTLDMSPNKNDRRKMMIMPQNYNKYEKMMKYGFGAQFTANALQINSGSNTFSNIGFLDNLAQTEWSWSVLLADYDNDGLKDIHITNGYLRDVTNNDYARYKMDELQKKLNQKQITLKQWIEEIPSIAVPSFLFKNKGNTKFEDVSKEWNSGKPTFSNGAAYSDLDNDGFLDIVVNNINEVPFVMKNNGKQQLQNNFISLDFEFIKGKNFQGTIGKLTLSDGTVLKEQYNPTRGFLSSSQHKLHFGIKEGLTTQSLEIIWPDKSIQVIDKPQLNEFITIQYNPTSRLNEEQVRAIYFEDKSSLLGNKFSHKENEFTDFKREALLHHKYSEEGPAVAIADVNGDGLEDVYFGGAKDFSGKLLLQNKNGRFSQKEILDFEVDKTHEDTDAIFFDANNDGNIDLYVVSGGNESSANTRNYLDRMYFGNGKGDFSRVRNVLPEIYTSGAVVKVEDIDGDGQQDVFIGSRVTPGRYPITPRSYILKNENGLFKDITSVWAKQISNIGMVTDAEFADLDNDGIKELIIAGEWLPISVFKFENGAFKNKTKEFGLDQKVGWWNSVTVSDVNGDGYKDIVAGNLGLNSIFKASSSEPVELYYKDFDNNGSIDPVITTYADGVSYPLHNRDRMLDHMVMLKKRFTRYEPYANATINDIFTPQELQNVSVLKANHFQHTLFVNQNGKGFMAKNLPAETQISVLNDAIVTDLNGDNKVDIITGGNFFGTDAEYGRYDASIGATLINSGNSIFEILKPLETGLNIGGNVQHLKQIKVADKSHILVVRNNDASSLIKIKND